MSKGGILQNQKSLESIGGGNNAKNNAKNNAGKKRGKSSDQT